MLSVVESVRFDTCLRNYTAACTRHIVRARAHTRRTFSGCRLLRGLEHPRKPCPVHLINTSELEFTGMDERLQSRR